MSNNYSVIITSASGSVTSSVVTLSLQLPPITPVFSAADGTFNFFLDRGVQPDVSIAVRAGFEHDQLD